MEIEPDPQGADRLLVAAPEWEAVFEVYGACPVQAFGTVRGRALYFRARCGVWCFEIADGEDHLPSDGGSKEDGFLREGIDQAQGFMSLLHAVALIEECLLEYVETRPGSEADAQ